ncbi:unnamed protein product [Aspergillus oryzae var. brunneus]|uniref:Unnamed protein product n=1 Tax=Aspergillus oryzae var. brunneus TaxID=332754 RepID=A0ABQ6LEN2_ASPOZ|nr:unnamed protein product [Aspergillus oryzae var. brunneus]
MPAPAGTHPNPQAGVRNAPRRNDRRRQDKKAKPDHVEHATGGQPNARLRRLLRIRQGGREKRRQKKREEAQQALEPVPPPEWLSLDSITPLSFSDVPLPGPFIPTFPLAGSLSETHAVDREMPLETSEATDHIKYPKDEIAVQGPKIEGDEVDEGLNTLDGDESDVSDYWDSYEKYYPDIPSPSDGERDNGVIQSEQEIKDKQRAYEISKIEEVQNAYKSLKAALEKHNGPPTDFHRRHTLPPHDCDIKFLSNDYLILVLSREGVFAPEDPPPGAPQYFTFFGVRFDKDKERVKRESRLMKSQLVEKKPSPSPDSSFESANPWFEYIVEAVSSLTKAT